MPKAQSGSIQRRKADRNAPAPYAKPTEAHTEPDKENQDPVQQPSDNATNGKATPPSNDPLQDRTPVSPDNSNEAHNESAQSEKPSDYKDIVLEEIGGEVPCYENASAIRRKLNKLLDSKEKIPGTSKAWNKANLSKELCAIAERSHPIGTGQGKTKKSNNGASPAALGRFMKKSGGMGGGDSESYYWSNVLLGKLRIWNGEKKTKAREKAEEEFPSGRARLDPGTMYVSVPKGGPGPSYFEMANIARTESSMEFEARRDERRGLK